MVEYLDVYDSSMRRADPPRATKFDVHQKGLWHKTIHCWIVKAPDTILFQLRSPKHSDGDVFDVTASGHITAGEDVADGVRELKEELALDVDIKDLTFIGIYKQCAFRDVDSYSNREFAYNYFYCCDKPISEYLLQEEEVKGLYEMNINEGMKFFAGDVDTIKVAGMIQKNGEKKADTRTIKLSDMAMYHERCVISRHYLKIMIMAQRFLAGERYLAV